MQSNTIPAALTRLLWVGILSAIGDIAIAQTFTTVANFGTNNMPGWHPYGTLVQGPDGTLYGTTFDGESNILGTVFKLQPDGSDFTVLKSLTSPLEGEKLFGGL